MAINQLTKPSSLGSADNDIVNGLNTTTNPNATVICRCRWRHQISAAAKLNLRSKHCSKSLERVLSLHRSNNNGINFPSTHVQQRRLVMSESVEAKSFYACQQTAPRPPLPSTPYPKQYNWLNRRIFRNRPLCYHSGDLIEIKKLHSSKNPQGQKFRARLFLRAQRNRLTTVSSKVSPLSFYRMLNTGSSINFEEMILEDRGVNVRNIKNLIRDGPEATKWTNYLEAQKQNLRNSAVESSMDSSMKQHMTSATHVADNQKRYFILVMPQIKNIYKNYARSDHRISAVPWYLVNEIETERELSTPLGNEFVAGDGLERQRRSFPKDPLGKKSTLRMEFFGHGFDAEYRKQTDYGSVASIESSMFNVVPSGLLPVRRNKPQEDEWEDMIEYCPTEDEDSIRDPRCPHNTER